MEFTLDQNSQLKIDFKIEQGQWTYDLKGAFNEFDQHIRIKTSDGITFTLNELTQLIPSPTEFEVVVGDQTIGKVLSTENTVSIKQEDVQKLSAYEIKTLSNTQRLPKIINDVDLKKVYKPKTDLHTHMAGAVKAEDLISCATKNGTKPYFYPLGHLAFCGIDVQKYMTKAQTSDQFANDQKHNIDSWSYPPEHPTSNLFKDTFQNSWGGTSKHYWYLNLNDLTPEDKAIFQDSLSITSTKQIIFDDMESYYELRGMFTTDFSLFESYLEALAKDYQAQGIKHASISLSDIAKSSYLEKAEKVLPELEAKYGVKIKFLAALVRHESKESLQNSLEYIKVAAQHPCIEGIDFLASETNSTFEFYDALHSIAAWAQIHNPHFVLRIHAGETPYYPENVRAALAIAKQYGLKVRVGHGIYGVDEETIKLAQELAQTGQIIVEMNPDSNYSLNNIDNTAEYPLVTYAKAGIPVVLGSDGHGLYQTDNSQLVRHLQYLDLGGATIAQIEEALMSGDALYQAWEAKLTAEKTLEYDAALKQQGDFKTVFMAPQDSLIDAKTIRAKYDAIKKEHTQQVDDKLRDNNIVFDDSQVQTAIKGKTPIFFNISLDPSDPDSFRKCYAMLETIINNIDPNKAYIVTSGRDHAFEPIIHAMIQERNKTAPDKLILLGAIGKDTPAKDISSAITHAVRAYDKWFDFPKYFCDQIEKNKAQAIFVGGDMLARDMIQAGYNQITEGIPSAENTQMYLLQGPKGAANDKANHLPPQFKAPDEDDILKRLMVNANVFPTELTEQELLIQHRQAVAKYDKQNDAELMQKQGSTDRHTLDDKIRWFTTNCNIRKITDITPELIKDFLKSENPIEHEVYKKIRHDRFLVDEVLPMIISKPGVDTPQRRVAPVLLSTSSTSQPSLSAIATSQKVKVEAEEEKEKEKEKEMTKPHQTIVSKPK